MFLAGKNKIDKPPSPPPPSRGTPPRGRSENKSPSPPRGVGVF